MSNSDEGGCLLQLREKVLVPGEQGSWQLAAGSVHLQLLPTSSEHAHLDVPRHVKHQPVNPRKCVMGMHLLMPMDLAEWQAGALLTDAPVT